MMHRKEKYIIGIDNCEKNNFATLVVGKIKDGNLCIVHQTKKRYNQKRTFKRLVEILSQFYENSTILISK